MEMGKIMSKVLAIDIGGTSIKYAIMGEEMEILSKGKAPTPQEGREQLVNALASIYEQEPVDGVAISMPGIIDTEKGLCLMGGALRYNDNFNLRAALAEHCPAPIHIENDAKCAAMAEAAMGSLKDVDDGFVILLGTMIGGAYIKDKKLCRGRHFSAGEVSYMITDRAGQADYAGIWGNRCSTAALCKMYAERKGLPESKVNGEVVFAAVNIGEQDALECLGRYAKELAVQIFNLQTVLDPERFAIGGGISAEPALIMAIREQLDMLYEGCPYYVPRAEVTPCQFRNDANLYGAVRCYQDRWSNAKIEHNSNF